MGHNYNKAAGSSLKNITIMRALINKGGNIPRLVLRAWVGECGGMGAITFRKRRLKTRRSDPQRYLFRHKPPQGPSDSLALLDVTVINP